MKAFTKYALLVTMLVASFSYVIYNIYYLNSAEYQYDVANRYFLLNEHDMGCHMLGKALALSVHENNLEDAKQYQYNLKTLCEE